MVRREKTKTTALVLVAVMIAVYVCQLCDIISTPCCAAIVPDGSPSGILKCSLFVSRLLYPFQHVSLLHVLLNSWAFLTIVFYYNIGITRIVIACLVAVTAPASLWGLDIAANTIGFSSVVFCLLGQVSFLVQRKSYFHLWVLSFIAFGYIISYLCSACGYVIATPNNLLHLYCYVAGLLVGFLNAPAPWQKSK